MGGFERRRVAWPDRRPPPPVPGAGGVRCETCGEPVATDERDIGEPPRHLVCDAATRSGLLRRLEASRAVHRAIAALVSVPILGARLAGDIAALPDACDVGDAMTFLSRARTIVECSQGLTAQQRRIALSYVDATSRKLAP